MHSFLISTLNNFSNAIFNLFELPATALKFKMEEWMECRWPHIMTMFAFLIQ